MTKAKEKPILFSGPMVRAILDGRKTQTRRVIKGFDPLWTLARFEDGVLHRLGLQDGPEDIVCPYKPGMRLWVRETFDWVAGTESICRRGTQLATRRFEKLIYAADGCNKISKRWTAPMHMPRWASRITLEVASIRAERVQNISAKDIISEGAVLRSHQPNWDDRDWPVSAFDGACYPDLLSLWRSGWDSLNAKRGFGWASNPWVWVIEFRRINP